MFRKHSSHPKTNAFDVNKIQQHIGTINFLADTLLISSSRHHLNSNLAVLRHAINQFEQNRFADYIDNNTERAEQVLHTRQIFKELYKHQLKKSDYSLIAKVLKDELRDYASSVKGIVSEIQSDLITSLQDKHDAATENQSLDLLNQELDRLQRDTQACYLSARLAEIDSPENAIDISVGSDDQNSGEESTESPSYISEEDGYETSSESHSPSSQRLFRLSTSSNRHSNLVSDSDETDELTDFNASSPRTYR